VPEREVAVREVVGLTGEDHGIPADGFLMEVSLPVVHPAEPDGVHVVTLVVVDPREPIVRVNSGTENSSCVKARCPSGGQHKFKL
jgi:hypothetical protein